jgi:hypothetical protein
MRRPDVQLPANAAFVAALSVLPLLTALAGAGVDERLRLGVTVWRAACRATGLTPRSLAIFTFELLPGAVIGALLGGILVLAWAIGSPSAGRAPLAAHLGCWIAMPVGAFLCASTWPVAWMLAAEVLIAGGAALGIHRLLCGYAVARTP